MSSTSSSVTSSDPADMSHIAPKTPLDPSSRPQIIITSDSFRRIEGLGKLRLGSGRFDTGSNSTLVESGSGASSATGTDDDHDTYFSPVEYDEEYVKHVVDLDEGEDNVDLTETEDKSVEPPSPCPPTAMDEKTRTLLKIQESWGDDSSFVDGADYTFECEGDDADITAFMGWKRPSHYSHRDERHTGNLTPSHIRNHSSPRLSSLSDQSQPTPSLSTSLPSTSTSLPSRWAFERPRSARKASLEEQDLADSSEMVMGAFGVSWTTLWVDDMQERVKSSSNSEPEPESIYEQKEQEEVAEEGEGEEEDGMDIGDIFSSRSAVSSPTKAKVPDNGNDGNGLASPHRPHHPHSRTSFSRSLRQRMAW